jgi:hypothetical protein
MVATNSSRTISHSREPSPPSGVTPNTFSIHSGKIVVRMERIPLSTAIVVASQNRNRSNFIISVHPFHGCSNQPENLIAKRLQLGTNNNKKRRQELPKKYLIFPSATKAVEWQLPFVHSKQLHEGLLYPRQITTLVAAPDLCIRSSPVIRSKSF